MNKKLKEEGRVGEGGEEGEGEEGWRGRERGRGGVIVNRTYIYKGPPSLKYISSTLD